MRVLFRLLVFFAIVAAIGAGVYYFLLKGEGKKPIEVTPQDIVTGKLFPEGSNLLVYFNIEDTLADPDVQDAYEQLAAQYPIEINGVMTATLNDLLNELRVKAGGQLDPRDFTEAVLFADLDTFDEEGGYPFIGVIVSGTFTMSDLAPLFQSIPDATVTTSEYKGLTLYKIAFASEKGPQIGVAFLGEGVLVAGTLDAAEDVIDVAVGDAPSLSSGPVYEAYNSLGSVFKFAIELPPEARADMEPPFDAVDTVGLSIDKSGQTISVEAMLHFANDTVAQDALQAIQAGIPQALQDIQADPNLPAQAKALISGVLSKVSASISDSWLTVQLSVTKAEIEGLVDLIQQLQQYLPQLPGGEEEAQNTEFNNIIAAVASMMADNNISTIPSPVLATSPAVNNMALFPDSTSVAGSANKLNAPGGGQYVALDKNGFLLYTHDLTADGAATPTVNYITFQTSKYYYTIDAAGNVTQWDSAPVATRVQLNP